jgi:hypothetical protein
VDVSRTALAVAEGVSDTPSSPSEPVQPAATASAVIAVITRRTFA